MPGNRCCARGRSARTCTSSYGGWSASSGPTRPPEKASRSSSWGPGNPWVNWDCWTGNRPTRPSSRRRSEEHTSELQSRRDLVCRLLLEKKKKKIKRQERQKQNKK